MKRRVLSFIIALTLCLNLCPAWALDAGEGTDGGLCPHHPPHTDECGYVPGSPGAPCTFACQICPVEDLIGKLPGSVSENNREQVQAQLSEINTLYGGLTADEQQQVDLSPCMALLDQLGGMGVAVLSDGLNDSSFPDNKHELTADYSMSVPFKVNSLLSFRTNGYTFTGTESTAIQVTGTGKLYLTGRIDSTCGAGVEVLSGGFLSITEPETFITGAPHALDIAAGAEVHLSTGKYSAYGNAIQTADGNLAALLEPGYAFFDSKGNPLLPNDAANATTIVIGQCLDHSGKRYTHTSGTTEHTWTCPYCGVKETEACTFTFNQDGEGTCTLCGNKVTIVVNVRDLTNLVYDGTMKPGDVSITVTLNDGSNKVLEKDTDYRVVYEPRKDAGEITVTVTGITFNGSFTKTYTVAQDKPGLSWANSNPIMVNYDGAPVEAGDLPGVNINIQSQVDNLQGYLQYSYKKQGDTDYTDGLPKDAGTYEVTVSLPVLPNFEGAVSDPIMLTIDPINPIVTAPAAKTLTYNRNSQVLVTAGILDPAAVADGLVIEYATEEKGTYSTEIPSDTNAGDYTVWYQVVGLTDNYIAPNPNPAKIDGVEILRKQITPIVTLSESSYLYDGTKKDPKITVKDDKTVIDEDQYGVTWAGTKSQTPAEMLTVADTYTATIENVTDGNYTFSKTVTVEIVAAEQAALKITGKPSHVHYGDTITTLDTTGGSGTGTVTWSITDGGSSSTITPTGKLTVKDTGSITVEAKRTVPNYGTVTDEWTFTVEPKPVTAEVTIRPKDYDGTTDIADDDIGATVKATDLVDPADSITITGLKGAYVDANAGTNKPVTLDGTSVSITCDAAKYAVSIPAAAQADIKPRQVTVTVTLSDHDLQTDAKGWFYVYDSAEKKPAVTVTADDDHSILAGSDYTVSYTNNKNVGDATVTVKSAAGGNYTFDEKTENFEIRNSAAILTATPQAKDLTYDGTAQDLVTVGTATGGTVVYSSTGAAGSYSETIPTETNAGTYTVYYMVKGDANHDDTTPGQVSVTIKRKEITPKITLNPTSYVYDGTARTPGVTVEDGDTVIPGPGTDKPEYTVTYRDNINAGTAAVIVSDANGGNYIVNGTATFEITTKAPVFAAPEGKTGLQYNGAPQELVKAGVTGDGTVVYSVDGGNYSPAIPTATAVGQYTIDYKVLGDANHSDVDSTTPLTVEIEKNTVNNPAITLSSDTFRFNGSQQKPTITVCDDNGLLIPEHEYTVTITGVKSNNVVDVDTYTVTVTTPATSNYDIKGNSTRTFKIVPADQETISITGTQAQVRYGDTIQLGVTGGTGSGTVTWTVAANDGSTINSTISATGLLTVLDVGGPFMVTATRSKDGNYKDVSATWEFSAAKKQVTAVVTATDRKFIDNDKTVTVTATIPDSELVSGDSITISGLTGTFDDPNVGTDKQVTVDSTNAAVTGTNAENYDITYPATTASILAESARVDTAPGDVDPALTYDASQAQPLVTAGTATGGIMVYSLDGSNFTPNIPTAKDAGTYTVYFKAQGDGNHTDSAVDTTTVTIGRQSVTPQIELTPPSAQYDGNVKRPEVTLRDTANNVIPASEYKVTYVSDNGENWMEKGTYTVKVEDISGGNYVVADSTETFTISTTAQNPLEIVNEPGLVYYGDTFTLSAVGGSGSAAVTWSVDNANVVEIDANGFVKIIGTGSATITATKLGGTNYDTVTATYPLNALKKRITAIVTADDKPYDGDTRATIHIAWKDGDLLNGDTIDLDNILTGTFNNADAGNDKTVTITGTVPDNDKYAVTYNTTTTASITPKPATVTGVTANQSLIYSGQPQALVTAGTVDGGNVMYSLDGGASYSLDGPKATNAGTYTVWYKAVCSGNYADSIPASVSVTIDPKPVDAPVIELSPESFDYDGTAKKPDVVVKDGSNVIPTSEYTVSYSNNTAVGTATVTISDNTGGNYTVNGSKNFTIKAGEAVLKDAPKANNLTYNGFAQELVTGGTAVNGQVVYSETQNSGYSTSIPTKTDAGSYQIWYKVQGANGAADTTPKSVIVTIQPKQVTPAVIMTTPAVTYDGTPKTPAVLVHADGKMLTQGTDYDIFYSNNTDPGTAMIVIWSKSGTNYQFTATVNFEIVKGAAKFTAQPTAKTGLVYNGTAQELVTPGVAEGGIIFYSLDGVAYSGVIPTGTERKSYTVYAKVVGNSTHADSDVITIPVTIGKNVLTADQLNVTLSANSFQYTGYEQKPTVTVTDDGGNVISADEYTVTYSDNVNEGTAKINIKSKTSGNYSFTATAEFQILGADQPALTITGKPDTVCYGDILRLSTTGGSGTVTWTVGSGNAMAEGNGQFKITGSGSITIKAEAGGSFDTWAFYANPKTVTAVVTAANKPYDGNNTATLTVTLSSGLVSGDIISSGDVTAAGYFADVKAGTNKTVIITGLTVPDAISAKYDIQYPAITTASITPADAAVQTPPENIANLKYTGLPQPLVTSGAAANGNMAYSLDGVNYSFNVPEGTDAKTYTVWYKAAANDENHKDSAPVQINAAIAVNTDIPSVMCTPNTLQYDGMAKTPTVVVRDSGGHIIPESEYTVTVNNGPAIAVGKYTVTVTDNPGGNYAFTSPVTVTDAFEIVAASQNPLTVVNKPAAVYYGDTFRLSATGGSGSGAIKWSIAESSIATIKDDGTVTVTGTGGFTVKAYREASDGYDKSNTDSVPFYAKPKPVTPTVTADDKPYDGTTDATLHASWKPGDLVGNDTINLDSVSTGTFDSATVGTNKRVTFVVPTGLYGVNGNYYITWPDSTTASIYKVDAKMQAEPQAIAGLTYDGSAKALVTAGTTVNRIGTIVYSTSQNGVYSEDIPTGTNAGEYTVWYKVADSVNYTGVDPAVVEVEIAKATPTINTYPTASGTAGQTLSEIELSGGQASVAGRFDWEDGRIPPKDEEKYNVVFTPNDTANYNPYTFQIIVTVSAQTASNGSGGGGTGSTLPDTPPSASPSTPDSGPGALDTSSTPTQTTVQDGTASTVVSGTDGSKLVQEAVANQSQNVVIKPEIASDVTKTEVLIPSSTVSQLSSETDAALTVASPIADVTISNAALDTLSRAGGAVSVAAEKTEQTVVLTLAVDDEIVEQVPGGLTLTVPAEDAGPGTVAVLVHEDGSRETIRKSVAADGVMSIPLSGSATVEIVDNSKDFTDVPPESWAADAVAFASAHELFSGTSETAFSPDEAMSRGMLVTVLYRLDGSPELNQTGAFRDVSSDAWYAEGVAWAVENGIADGYGDGQFGPDESITREQFVVMLWRYAGSPEAGSQVLDFVDADQASSYAQAALRWAVENGILSGVGRGMLDPRGTATRAQAAQLLKNFMENT